ncbi:CPCC family cysteine-rich protein [Pedobacter sp. UBA5917]|uniref:CPCC family cysteine-rich protein n=1 Tax=Pedobacter sp. UBA5917 TaxID=1947061 RepID=UPI0026008568|nr:CPCC family cysteine-rich protein [Pedobacter sp. UBA5917]
MEHPEDNIDDLKTRRDYFQRNFPMVNIVLERTDINSYEVLKNTCANCGYLTLKYRAGFDICGFCFWEDDGDDDFEEDKDSGPNHMSLKEGRLIFYDAKMKLMDTKYHTHQLITTLKSYFSELDTLISIESSDKDEIIELHHNIQDLLDKNKIYGLESIFNNTH